MCGIAGAWCPRAIGSPEDVEERVRRMIDMVQHRGPDDSGTWSDGRVGLASTRLAILDLSPAAHQPMADASGRIRLVFNGEVYNFVDLREELIGLGHRFRSTSDTEVILLGYVQWGERVVARLRGMFALAIWDADRDRLLIARDRLGQKPLNYAWSGGSLVFGSEIKSLLRWPGFERTPNLTALSQYFQFRYVPGTDTAFSGVHRLEPAHFMTVDALGRIEKHRYWDLPEPVSGPRRDPRALREDLLVHLDEAVRLRMISDVPIGAFLSGGVDSSAVVSSMAMASPEPVRTFTVGFETAGIDERRYARMVAERCGTSHREYVVSPDIEGVITSLAWFYGEPFADEVAIPTYCISAIARREVTVALNGDGGDESFFGYRRHAASRVGARIDHIPRPLLRIVSAAGGLPGFQGSNRTIRNFGKALAAAARAPVERYTDWVTYGSDDLLDALATGPSREQLYTDALDRFAPFFADGIRPDDAASRADLQTLLNEGLQVRLDIATMATGLEGRSPFLDHVFVEWAATIPATQKMRRLKLKSLLKEALLPRLPREVMYRPKQGLFMDFSFLSDQKELICDMILSPEAATRGLLDPTRVRALLHRHYNGGNRLAAEVWMLFILEQWFQMWIDPPAVPDHPPPTPRIDA